MGDPPLEVGDLPSSLRRQGKNVILDPESVVCVYVVDANGDCAMFPKRERTGGAFGDNALQLVVDSLGKQKLRPVDRTILWPHRTNRTRVIVGGASQLRGADGAHSSGSERALTRSIGKRTTRATRLGAWSKADPRSDRRSGGQGAAARGATTRYGH